MEENGLVEYKLSIFQKIRKNFYLRGMKADKAEKYAELPDALKYDEEIIRAVVASKPEMINSIPATFIPKLIAENPNLLNYIKNLDITQKLIETNPEICVNLNEDLMYNLIFNPQIKGDKSFISKLPSKIQKKLLAENIKYTPYERNASTGFYSKNQYSYATIGDKKQLDLRLFPDEIILEIAIEDEEEINKKHGKIEWGKIYNLDISKMNLSAQLKLILLDYKYMEKTSEEAIDEFVQDNPLLLEKTPPDYRINYLNKHRDMISRMPYNMQKEFYEKNKYLKDPVKSSEMSYGFVVRDFPDVNEAKKRLISENFMNRYWGTLEDYNITDIRDDKYIWEMGQFSPDLLQIRERFYNNDFAKQIRAGKLCENYYNHLKEINPYGPVTKFFEQYAGDPRKRYSDPQKEWEKINKLAKFVLNEDVITRVPQEDIMEYVEEPSNEKLATIVRKTYGEKAAKIILDRPQIGIEHIPNLYIFHPTIIENFGIGAVHANLAYTMNTSAMFSEFARNPKLLDKYKIFKELSGNLFEDTAIDLEKSMKVFVQAESLLDSIIGKELTEEQKRTLQVAILDAKTDNTPEIHNAIPFPKNIEELEEYEKTKNKIYDDAMQKLTDPYEIKELLCQKYFGMRFVGDFHNVSLDNPSVLNMCNFYNLHDFVNDKKVIQTGKFTQDDLDALELLDIIKDINDVDVLRTLASELAKSKDIINPLHYTKLKKNVPLMYSEEMVKSLTTIEDAERMVAQGNEGISIREEDGVKIVTLKGADFKAYISNPYMYNSQFIRVDEPLNIPEMWNTVEGGISTFSGCLIDPSTTDEIHAIDKSRPNLGFYSINPNQVVGMGATDIHVSHDLKRLKPSTTEAAAISFDFSDELLDKTAERFFGRGDSDVQFHHYNEVASQRRIQRLSEIEEGTNGGKISPDFLFVYGKGKGHTALEMAKKFGINVIFEYDEEAYKSRRYELYRQRKLKQKEMEDAKDSKLMKDVKEIVKGEESQDGRE